VDLLSSLGEIIEKIPLSLSPLNLDNQLQDAPIDKRPPVFGLSEEEAIQFTQYFECLGEKYDISVGIPDMETILEIIRDNAGTIDPDNKEAIDIFIAVSTPSDVDKFNEKLENAIASESILTNVAQWKKEMETQQSRKIERQIELMREIEEFEKLLEDDVEDSDNSLEYELADYDMVDFDYYDDD